VSDSERGSTFWQRARKERRTKLFASRDLDRRKALVKATADASPEEKMEWSSEMRRLISGTAITGEGYQNSELGSREEKRENFRHSSRERKLGGR